MYDFLVGHMVLWKGICLQKNQQKQPFGRGQGDGNIKKVMNRTMGQFSGAWDLKGCPHMI